MKRLVSIALVLMLMMSTAVAYADIYTAEEILPSLSHWTDEELATVLEAITAEQNIRNAAKAEEEAEALQAKLEEEEYIERPTVQRGDKGEEAKAVQERLIELGFLAGVADGDFGKKSEAAVILFQKANGLEETGIADSITRHVMLSASVIDKEAYDNMPIMVGDGWELLKEWYYTTKYINYKYYAFTLKNTSGYTAEIGVSAKFYDADDNLVGVADKTQNACENGYVTYWDFSNDDIDFDHVELKIRMSKDKYYEGAQSVLQIETSVVEDKVIISATNTGDEPVEFAEYNALFLDENGEIVYTNWGYIGDDDTEIKPGATEMEEANAFGMDFAEAHVYVLGRIDD